MAEPTTRARQPKRHAHLPHGRWLGDLGDLSPFEKRLVAACARGEVCAPDNWDDKRPEADAATEAPPSEDLMNRARNPKLERIIRARRENGCWLGLLDEAQSSPKDLEDYHLGAQRALAAEGLVIALAFSKIVAILFAWIDLLPLRMNFCGERVKPG
jgi:hypothetical protein